jgi:cytochrome c oxidase subunit 1
MYSKRPAKVAWFLATLGFNALYIPFLILGYVGMPRRYYHYLPQFQSLHLVATIGSWILVLGLIIMFANLFIALRRGSKAPANPWGGETLEWTVPSPPPLENFDVIPSAARGPYDYSKYEKTGEVKA